MSEIRNIPPPRISASELLRGKIKLRAQVLTQALDIFTEESIAAYLSNIEIGGLSESTKTILIRVLPKVSDDTSVFNLDEEDDSNVHKHLDITSKLSEVEGNHTQSLKILYQGSSNEFIRWAITVLRTRVIIMIALGYDESVVYPLVRKNLLHAFAIRFVDSEIPIPISLVTLLDHESREEIEHFWKKTKSLNARPSFINKQDPNNALLESIKRSLTPVKIGLSSRAKIEGIIELSYSPTRHIGKRKKTSEKELKEQRDERLMQLLQLMEDYPDPGVLTDILIYNT